VHRAAEYVGHLRWRLAVETEYDCECAFMYSPIFTSNSLRAISLSTSDLASVLNLFFSPGTFM
jgi:hypothetical protein